MEGDFVEDSIEGSYDSIWMSHILHGESSEVCNEIIQKAVHVLESGGMLVIHEFILNNSNDGPLFPVLFSLNMLLGGNEGRSYSEKELMEMLTNAGLTKIQRSPFRSPNDSGLMMATKN